MLLALAKKELALQRVPLGFAAFGLAVWAAMMAFPRLFHDAINPVRLTGFHLSDLIRDFAIAPCLTMIAPLLFGVTAVAPERALGALEWQMGQPVSRRLQWGIKCAIAGGLAILAAGILYPLLNATIVGRMGAIYGPEGSTDPMSAFLEAVVYGPSADEAPANPALGLDALRLACLGLWIAASGAYISTVARGSISAFFLALIPAIGLAIVPRVADPSGLLLPARYPLYARGCLPLLTQLRAAALAISLLTIAGWNYRFDPPRRRAILGQAALAYLVANLIDAAIVHHEFRLPLRRPAAAAGRPELAPLAELDPQEVPRALALPLARNLNDFDVRDLNPGALDRPPIFRVPGTDRLAMSLPLGRVSSLGLESFAAFPGWGGIVEVDAANGRFWQRFGAFGALAGMAKSRPGYIVTAYGGYGYHRRLYPLAPRPRLGDWLDRALFMRGEPDSSWVDQDRPSWEEGGARWVEARPTTPPSSGGQDNAPSASNHRTRADHVLRVSPDPLDRYPKFLSRSHRVVPSPGLYFYQDDPRSCPPWGDTKAMLLRLAATGPWPELEIVDEPKEATRYCASRDGRWFSRQGSALGGPLAIQNSETGASWRLENRGDRIVLTGSDGRPTSNPLLAPHQLGPDPFELRVSEDGRWLAFARVQTLKVPMLGQALETPEAESASAAALDLSNGREIALVDLPQPPRHDAQWHRQHAQWSDGVALKSDDPRDWQLPQQVACRFMPCMAWSPDGNLAILRDNKLLLFRPEGAGEGASLRRIAQIDVGPARAERFAFLDAKRILLIGSFSLWRLDLDKAAAPPAP